MKSRQTTFSRTGGFPNAKLPIHHPLDRMSLDMRTGVAYGLELAAAACRTHVIMMANRYGANSDAVRAAELDLYCMERGLRHFR
jgi:hypothetical protein